MSWTREHSNLIAPGFRGADSHSSMAHAALSLGQIQPYVRRSKTDRRVSLAAGQ